MTEDSRKSGDQVLMEGLSLPPPLRNDLQGFLERQPEVRAVTRKLQISDAVLNPDTVWPSSPRFEFVVHLAGCPQASTADAPDHRAATDPQESREMDNRKSASRKLTSIIRIHRQLTSNSIFPVADDRE